jgi:hypothetical protein
MNCRCFLFLVCVLLSASPVWSAGTDIAVYEGGRVFVIDQRVLDLPKGRNHIEVGGVPETIIPQTLEIDFGADRAPTLLSVDKHFDLLSESVLLKHFVGKDVELVLPDGRDANARLRKKARLLSVQGRPIFRIDDAIYVGPYESIRFPEIPEGLLGRAALLLDVQSDKALQRDVEMRYMATGMGWSADYVLTLNEKADAAALTCWISVDNRSGMDFSEAGLRGVSGDVNMQRVNDMQSRKFRTAVMAEAAPAFAAPTTAPAFEYHVYDFPETMTLKNNSNKRMLLRRAGEVPVTKTYTARWAAASGNRPGDVAKQPVEVSLEFVNSKEHGLGTALPKGIVRAYGSKDGKELFLGEDRVQRLPEDAKAKVKAGRAFDLGIERILVTREKDGRNLHRVEWEMELRNASKESKRVTLLEEIPGEFDIVEHSAPFRKVDARTIAFDVDVPAGNTKNPVKLRYTTSFRY